MEIIRVCKQGYNPIELRNNDGVWEYAVGTYLDGSKHWVAIPLLEEIILQTIEEYKCV